MKIKSEALSNLTQARLFNLIDEELGRFPASRIEQMSIDEAMFCLQIKQELAAGKKRIVLDIKYE